MLEKIGLPSKPSLRGNIWSVDATHCQGCSSHFTFINRKHHCRRCGGIFCNSCSYQRMVLRGQGDSAVRICEPCKKVEEAARFEMRHGYRNRAGRGGSKHVLNQILGNNDFKESVSSGQESSDMLPSVDWSTRSASCSNSLQVNPQNEGVEVQRSLSSDADTNELTEMGPITPEELRQQALDEKKKYKILKSEGKSEEALRSFKRGKELERQAGVLELHIRKICKKASSSINVNEIEKIKDVPAVSVGKNKSTNQTNKDKDDLGAELRELGWSDNDLHDADKNSTNMSLEGELYSLLGDVSQKSNIEKGTRGIDKSQVIVHKRKALALKREGKLAEAKEELKRAKVLEKQIEEQEFLIDDDDSDDELSSLIRSMDDDRQDDLSIRNVTGQNFSFDQLLGMDDGLGVDNNFEVTDEDMDDPEMTAALKLLGWSEDTNHHDNMDPQFVHSNRETRLSEIQSLKREAITQKRAGNTAEAMSLLKKAKLFERDLDRDSHEINLTPQNSEPKDTSPKLAPKSKLMIQKELLSLKKKALALRREGKLDEAEEELKKGKALEHQLEEMDTASQSVTQANVRRKNIADNFAAVDVGDEEADVTDQDMHDPSYLLVLKNLGWNDEDNENISTVQASESSVVPQVHNSTQIGGSKRSKGEIQRELLGWKRKSLALRRQGETDEAEEVLKMAKHLEAQLEEIEAPKQVVVSEFDKHNNDFSVKNEVEEVIKSASPKSSTHEKIKEIVHASKNQSSLKQGILAHKRKAISLKREGKLAEAKEELRQAKLLEKRVEDENPRPIASLSDVSSSNTISVEQKESSLNSPPKMSSRDRFKLQQESLSHKRQALKLRRDGRMEEAEAEFALAKALETQLDEMGIHDSLKSSVNVVDDVGVEDFLDPQLLSALKAIGLEDGSTKSVAGKIENASEEKMQLEERIKTEKVKAVNLKRSGKQAEALDALRRAKLLEKKLSSLASV